jgi:PAS domain S-box-containing protein
MNEIPAMVPAMTGKSALEMLDELPVAYVEINAHGVITHANRVACGLLTAQGTELAGKLIWGLMPLGEQEQSRAAFLLCLELGEEPPVVRRSLYTSRGEFRVCELHRGLIRDEQGHPVGMRYVGVDVTESHNAYEEARRARLWLESVIASLADAVIVTDALGFIRSVNPAAETLFGWKAGELTGRLIEEALPVLSCSSGGKTEYSFARLLESHCRGTAILLDRGLQEVRAEISASPIVDKDQGFTAGLVCVLRQLKEAS